jgi:hypothetical protein
VQAAPAALRDARLASAGGTGTLGELSALPASIWLPFPPAIISAALILFGAGVQR